MTSEGANSVSSTALPELRAAKLGYTPDSAKDLIERVSEGRRNIPCPDCGTLMTVVKSHSDRMHETVVYQCHASVTKMVPREKASLKVEGICGLVIQLTDSVKNMMRPGDFVSHDIGWKDVAAESITLEAAAKILPKTKKFEGIKIKPEYPGQRETLNKVLFDEFWVLYAAYGEVKKSEFDKNVQKIKGNNPKVAEGLRTFAQMFTSRTGYAVQLRNGVYIVTGRTLGANGALGLPYSDPEYKKLHGFSS